MTSITGHTTVVELRAIRSSSGSSHPFEGKRFFFSVSFCFSFVTFSLSYKLTRAPNTNYKIHFYRPRRMDKKSRIPQLHGGILRRSSSSFLRYFSIMFVGGVGQG